MMVPSPSLAGSGRICSSAACVCVCPSHASSTWTQPVKVFRTLYTVWSIYNMYVYMYMHMYQFSLVYFRRLHINSVWPVFLLKTAIFRSNYVNSHN